jgi:hypothetical protein
MLLLLPLMPLMLPLLLTFSSRSLRRPPSFY